MGEENTPSLVHCTYRHWHFSSLRRQAASPQMSCSTIKDSESLHHRLPIPPTEIWRQKPQTVQGLTLVSCFQKHCFVLLTTVHLFVGIRYDARRNIFSVACTAYGATQKTTVHMMHGL